MLNKIFAPYLQENIRAVVLGCTHYPFIKNEINHFFNGTVKIYDGAKGTAMQTKRLLENGRLLCSHQSSHVEFLSSSPGERERKLFAFLLNQREGA